MVNMFGAGNAFHLQFSKYTSNIPYNYNRVASGMIPRGSVFGGCCHHSMDFSYSYKPSFFARMSMPLMAILTAIPLLRTWFGKSSASTLNSFASNTASASSNSATKAQELANLKAYKAKGYDIIAETDGTYTAIDKNGNNAEGATHVDYATMQKFLSDAPNVAGNDNTKTTGNTSTLSSSNVGSSGNTSTPSSSNVGSSGNTSTPSSSDVGSSGNTSTPSSSNVGSSNNTQTPSNEAPQDDDILSPREQLQNLRDLYSDAGYNIVLESGGKFTVTKNGVMVCNKADYETAKAAMETGSETQGGTNTVKTDKTGGSGATGKTSGTGKTAKGKNDYRTLTMYLQSLKQVNGQWQGSAKVIIDGQVYSTTVTGNKGTDIYTGLGRDLAKQLKNAGYTNAHITFEQGDYKNTFSTVDASSNSNKPHTAEQKQQPHVANIIFKIHTNRGNYGTATVTAPDGKKYSASTGASLSADRARNALAKDILEQMKKDGWTKMTLKNETYGTSYS